MKKAFLVAGGELNTDFLKEYLQNATPSDIIIAIDAGLHYLDRISVIPDLIIGDFDSVEETLLQKYSQEKEIPVIRYDPIKDATDTELGVRLALQHDCTEVDILGAFGGRIDHMLSNLFLCCFSETHRISLLNETNRIYAIHPNQTEHRIYKDRQWGKYISFFPLTGEVTGLTLEGVKYPLYDKHLDPKKEPTLTAGNEILEEYARIRFQNAPLLVVESGEKNNTGG